MFKHAPHVLLAMFYVAGSAVPAIAQGQVTSTPNHVKYANAGAKPATGRSGSASLEARALIAKNGSMQVEASTGSVDAAAGPGEIAKVQIKIGSLTKNFNNLSAGGYWSSGFPGATRGTAIQVQGNIRGIDPKRTDVVTVSTPALLRPDLAVNTVNGPAQAAPQSQVLFIAEVTEKNGDVGATSNCVLSINGTEVDSAPGIWVDAADTVNCQFSRTFAQPGTYTVSVAATAVAPGDWDETNNQAQTTITIVEPSKKLTQGGLYAEQMVTTRYQRYWRNGGWYYNYDGETTEQVNRSYVQFNGWHAGGADVVQSLNAKMLRNGSLQSDVTLAPTYTSNYDDGYYYNRCGEYYNEYWNGSQWVYSGDRGNMCSSGYHHDPASASTNVWYQKMSGRVTYYAWEYRCDYYYYYGCGYYTWNNNEMYGSGSNLGWNAGDQIQLKVNFMDASGVSHTADKTVVLQDHSSQVNYSHTSNYYDWWYDAWYYNHQWQNGTLFRGSINWNDPQ